MLITSSFNSEFALQIISILVISLIISKEIIYSRNMQLEKSIDTVLLASIVFFLLLIAGVLL